jgi:hypothetical protein
VAAVPPFGGALVRRAILNRVWDHLAREFSRECSVDRAAREASTQIVALVFVPVRYVGYLTYVDNPSCATLRLNSG